MTITRLGAGLVLACSVLATLPIHVAHAATGEECAQIDDSSKRLLCYDLTFRTKVEAAVAEGTGAWQVRTEKSRIDDRTEVFITVSSDQVVPSKYGFEEGQYAQLMVRCQENKTALTVWFGGQFMASSGGYDQVTYRIDDKPAVNDRWTESTNNEAMGLWSGGLSIPLIKQLFGAQNLLLKATPFNESSITLDFKVGGLEAAIKPLRDACGW